MSGFFFVGLGICFIGIYKMDSVYVNTECDKVGSNNMIWVGFSGFGICEYRIMRELVFLTQIQCSSQENFEKQSIPRRKNLQINNKIKKTTNQQISKQVVGSDTNCRFQILARTYETMKKFLEFGMASSQERERDMCIWKWCSSLLLMPL